MKPFTFEINGKKCVALVRKLTETECGTLMGCDEETTRTIAECGVARTSQYKLYGNSIVVDVLYHIFRKAFVERGNEQAQMSIFDTIGGGQDEEIWNKEHPLRVVTLCSGYDSQCLALERLKKNFPDFDYELIAWSEFDPETPNVPLDKQPAVVAHNALFPQWKDRNLGDMTKIDWHKVPDFDFLFYSTPCQSISQAGLQQGFKEGSGTRSSIIWNVRDALKIKKPKYACLENVAAMVSEKFKPMFDLWRAEVRDLGYENFAKILNSKYYGVPQNRDRIFLFSIYDESHTVQYDFPKEVELRMTLQDVLQDDVDMKYYLNPNKVNKFIKDNIIMIEGYAKERPGEIEPIPAKIKEWLDNFPEEEMGEEPEEQETENLFNEDNNSADGRW